MKAEQVAGQVVDFGVQRVLARQRVLAWPVVCGALLWATAVLELSFGYSSIGNQTSLFCPRCQIRPSDGHRNW